MHGMKNLKFICTKIAELKTVEQPLCIEMKYKYK